jgi:putative tributyrin esterase
MQKYSTFSYRLARATLGILLWRLIAASVSSRESGLANTGTSVPAFETVQFQSTLIGKTLHYNVSLPRDYQTSPRTRYPVLYLLHGFSGHYSDWATRTKLADYAAEYRLIFVTPEGNNGWYTDSVANPADKYESYILQELIPDVDRRFRTIQSRYARGIAGLSMGGYGALKFGLKHPDQFVFAASLSGATATAAWTEEDLKGMTAIRDSLFGVFGPVGSDTRKKNDIFEMVRALTPARVATLPYFYLDCGTEDFLIDMNQQFAALLREKKIPHEYRELPGTHNWAYWDQQVREVLRIAALKMRLPSLRSRNRNARRSERSLLKWHAHVARDSPGRDARATPSVNQSTESDDDCRYREVSRPTRLAQWKAWQTVAVRRAETCQPSSAHVRNRSWRASPVADRNERPCC